MGQKFPVIKIDRGETVCPIAGDGLSKGAIYKMPEPFDHAVMFQQDLAKVEQELAALGDSLAKTRERIRRNTVELAKLHGEAEDRAALRKSAPPTTLADTYVTAAQEAVDANDDRALEKAVAALIALGLSADELSPRLAQIRRAAIQRNPRFLDILNHIRKG